MMEDYEKFVEKFKPKKTTDDCYTPEPIYEAVLGYVNKIYPLKDKKIIRPFYPGGDYANESYPAESVVIDNPPFSIMSKILKFYVEKDVPFFLFAPHLTLFTSDYNLSYFVTGAEVVYHNGAKVRTSFVSNMLKSAVIQGCPDLYTELKNLQAKDVDPLPKYLYPDNVITVSKIQSLVERGVQFSMPRGEAKHCRSLEDQKKYKKGIFGSGFLISDDSARALKAAAAAAAAVAAAGSRLEFKLSDKERDIIEDLNLF